MCRFCGDWWYLVIRRAHHAAVFVLPPTPASDPKVQSPIKACSASAYSGCVDSRHAHAQSLRAGLHQQRGAHAGVVGVHRGTGLITALVGIYVFKRRRIAEETGFTALASSELNEKRDLAQWRELPDTSRRVLIALLALNVRRAVALHVGTVLCHRWSPWP